MSFSQLFSQVSKGTSSNNTDSHKALSPPVGSLKLSSTNYDTKTGPKNVKTPTSVASTVSKADQHRRGAQSKSDRVKSLSQKASAKLTTTTSASPLSKTSVASKLDKPVKTIKPTASSSGSPAKKKLNFREIMKQAEKVDADNLKMTVKVRKETKRPILSTRAQSSISNDGNSFGETETSSNRNGMDAKTLLSSISRSVSPAKRPSSAPFSRPMDSLKKKLEGKKSRERIYNDDYGDVDGFVVSDEDQGTGTNGYRDEIRKIFSRNGQKRSYYDDYYDDGSSDMEATGSQVFDEEQHSELHARKEDVAEELELKRRAAAKMRRKECG